MLANPAWDVVPVETKRALAYSLWLPGQVYTPAEGMSPRDIAGMSSAQVFARYDMQYRALYLRTLPPTD